MSSDERSDDDDDDARSPSVPGEPSQGDPDAPPRFAPSESWIAAFYREYDAAMKQLVEGYAARRIEGVGPQPAKTDYPPRELVYNAISDTLGGAVRWNHQVKSLEQHLRDVIKRRAVIAWNHAKKYPHDSIDAASEDGSSPVMDEVDRTLLDRDDPRGRAFAAQALDEFCQLAEPDPELVAYIEAKADRATRAELMRITGLSLVRYRKVRRRLDRLSRRLSFQAAPRPRKRGK